MLQAVLEKRRGQYVDIVVSTNGLQSSCGVLAHHSCYRTRTREAAQAAVRVQQGEIRHILYRER